jgi:hypothetical protein
MKDFAFLSGFALLRGQSSRRCFVSVLISIKDASLLDLLRDCSRAKLRRGIQVFKTPGSIVFFLGCFEGREEYEGQQGQLFALR